MSDLSFANAEWTHHRVRVMANVICSMLLPNSFPTDEKTNVRRKKSSASKVHPRKQAMKVLRCTRFSDLKSRTASTSSHLNAMSSKVETCLREGTWPPRASGTPARNESHTHRDLFQQIEP